jgi:hypothetical protein
LSPIFTNSFENYNLDKQLAILLNYIASNGTREQVNHFYNQILEKTNNEITRKNKTLNTIMMEFLYKIGNEDAFEKQKTILNKNEKSNRMKSFHLFTALNLKKYQYVISHNNNSTINTKAANYQMIAQVRSGHINGSLIFLREFMKKNVDKVMVIYNETVSY